MKSVLVILFLHGGLYRTSVEIEFPDPVSCSDAIEDSSWWKLQMFNQTDKVPEIVTFCVDVPNGKA